MNTHVAQAQEKKSQFEADNLSRKQSGGQSASNSMANRPEAVAIDALQRMENDSPRVRQLKAFQDRADGRPAPKPRPIQKKESGSGSLGNSEPVVQRAINVDGVTFTAADKVAFDAEYNKDHQEEMVNALLDQGILTIEAALADDRIFPLTYGDLSFLKEGLFNYDFNPNGLKSVVTQVEGGLARIAGETPELVTRPAVGFQKIDISGLLSCVGIVIEAFKDDGVTAAVGAHFVTPEAITDGQLNDRGTGQLNTMLGLLNGYGEQRRAFLCYQQDEYSSQADENTVAALMGIRTYLTSRGVSDVKVSNTGGDISYILSSDGSISLS